MRQDKAIPNVMPNPPREFFQKISNSSQTSLFKFQTRIITHPKNPPMSPLPFLAMVT